MTLACLATAALLLAAPLEGKPMAHPEIDQLLQERRYDAALEAAQKAAAKEPKSAEAAFLVGLAHFYKEQDGPAIEAFGKAIALDPGYARAFFFRGLALQYRGEAAKARADLEAATRLEPANPKYLFELGKSKERSGDNAGALAALNRVVELDPKAAPALFAIGTIHGAKGDHAKAAELWERTLAVDPKYANAHFNLGVHHLVRGDGKRALEHFLAFHLLEPDDVPGIEKVIQAHYRLGQYKEAEVFRIKLLDRLAKQPVPGKTEFCFDQFEAPGGRVFAYESLQKEGELFSWFTFKLVKDDKVVKAVNLEQSDLLKERGLAFVLGMDEGSKHTTFGVTWSAMPEYGALKRTVLDALAGRLTAAASSTSK